MDAVKLLFFQKEKKKYAIGPFREASGTDKTKLFLTWEKTRKFFLFICVIFIRFTALSHPFWVFPPLSLITFRSDEHKMETT
jgi:hypothetical protein